jgi:hypothetical protein
MKPADSPSRESQAPEPAAREKPQTVPPYLDDDKVELVSWDAPLVPRE